MRLYPSLGACLFLSLTTGVLSGGHLSSPSSPSPPAPALLSRHCQGAAAAPGQEDPCGGAQVQFQATYDEQTYCKPGLFYNTTQGTPPRLADCQALLPQRHGHAGLLDRQPLAGGLGAEPHDHQRHVPALHLQDWREPDPERNVGYVFFFLSFSSNHGF
ncbi:hypothetical protein PG997_002107 [Apiospora hydei]|uniref:Uncharacterized protein n=1 Tax=Apiospora hydei TaxID=1337664 RepID=A0ABR1X8D8_9PEZI